MKFECMEQPVAFYVSGLSHCCVMYVPVRIPGQHVTDSCGQDGGRVWQSSPVDDKYLL